jgi:hypothetical protein
MPVLHGKGDRSDPKGLVVLEGNTGPRVTYEGKPGKPIQEDGVFCQKGGGETIRLAGVNERKGSFRKEGGCQSLSGNGIYHTTNGVSLVFQ